MYVYIWLMIWTWIIEELSIWSNYWYNIIIIITIMVIKLQNLKITIKWNKDWLNICMFMFGWWYEHELLKNCHSNTARLYRQWKILVIYCMINHWAEKRDTNYHWRRKFLTSMFPLAKFFMLDDLTSLLHVRSVRHACNRNWYNP